MTWPRALLMLHVFAVYGSDAATYVFDDSAGLGRTFDGIGGLSAGASSKLLVNYPDEQRSQILDYLFKPKFGASLKILKVEIGGDVQSTDGTEASHMHNSWDENYQRGYEWWLMVEAKKRNPNIKLYGLPWGFPGWIAAAPQDPYVDPQQTATYIVKWVQGAKMHYNLTIDIVGIWNERYYNATYVKSLIQTLRKVLDVNNLGHVSVAAADGTWDIADGMLEDADLAAAVTYIGAHYPSTVTTDAALKTGKQLWASEDYSTFNDNSGGGCWARIINQNYVNGHMTSTIAWNLITSYYENLPYPRNGLMTATEPWSGNYTVESPIWMSAHTTQFTEIGWLYLRHGNGVGHLQSGGSYVSLVSPDKKDLTIVIETLTQEHSKCNKPLDPYNVSAAQITIQLKGSFVSITQLQPWHSKPGFGSGDRDIYFEKRQPLKVTNGQVTLNVGVDEVWTLTTVSTGNKGSYPPPPPTKTFPLPYQDDFEGYAVSMEPNNFAQQLGSFEIVAEGNNKFIRQMVLQEPLAWWPNAEPKLGRSFSVIGDHSWTNISIKVDARITPVNGTSGVFLAARADKAGIALYDTGGVFFYVSPDNSSYILSSDLSKTQVVSTGPVQWRKGWNTIELRIMGEMVFGFVDGVEVVATRAPTEPTNGFAGLGTNNWGLADFDNLYIT
ncbi:galactocerebrosidase-like isoform X1 [Haliotis rufescens]|uniref:galactocerebrosidase-like isoform X1 n=1 Tax=Haliotis rufescens TaxID=6454 RepID=UPI00201F7D3D|nr:galactocerebrosidase-like isoform X1 [Haliotis rufescens]